MVELTHTLIAIEKNIINNNLKRKKMPKHKNKKYSKKQMKIARVAAPRNKITGADFMRLRMSKKRKTV
jgi:hypothetical protein